MSESASIAAKPRSRPIQGDSGRRARATPEGPAHRATVDRVHGVGLTSLWVAAMRAVETERPDGLFRDPFARRLAGEAGFTALARGNPPSGVQAPVVAVRTRFIDEAVRAALDAGTRQLVLVAAGMDSRAFRLEFPAGCRVFEIDRPEVLEYKSAKLGDATPRCERTTLPVDLRADWPAALRAAGFDGAAPAFWLLEGLLPYLLAPEVDRLLARVTELAAPGSEVLFDVASQAVLASPFMKERLEFVASLGAPWLFSTDAPEALLEPLGWDVDVVDSGVIGNQYGRWPFPRVPAWHARRPPELPRPRQEAPGVMAKTDFKSVDGYIAALPKALQPVLERVRGAIRKGMPAAEEVIRYQIPAYRLGGRAELYFAGWKEHYSLYPASAGLLAAFADELEGCEISKGTIRFPLARAVPVKLIERMARFRAKEAAERAQARTARKRPVRSPKRRGPAR